MYFLIENALFEEQRPKIKHFSFVEPNLHLTKFEFIEQRNVFLAARAEVKRKQNLTALISFVKAATQNGSAHFLL